MRCVLAVAGLGGSAAFTPPPYVCPVRAAGVPRVLAPQLFLKELSHLPTHELRLELVRKEGVATSPLAEPLKPEPTGLHGANGARALLALVAATYGTNYAAVKLLDEWVGEPSSAAALRFGIAVGVMLPQLLHMGSSVDRRFLSWPLAADGLLIGLFFWAGYATQAVALTTSAAGLQAFLLALSVVVCPILEALIDGKPQPPRVWGAAALAALGVLMLESGGLSGGSQLSSGDLIGLAQPVFFGAGFYQTEKAMRRHAHAGGASDAFAPAALTTWNLIAVATLSACWVAASGTLPELQATSGAIVAEPGAHLALIGAIAWTGIVTTAGCSVAEAAALRELTSSEATVVFATEPLWGAAFANVALGEQMDAVCLLGGALMIVACLVSAYESEAPQMGGASMNQMPTLARATAAFSDVMHGFGASGAKEKA